MQIQTIGSEALLVYTDEKELRQRGLRPHRVGLREVLLLVREAAEKAGVPLERLAEVEAFPEGQSVLIFVHLTRPEREWFRFEELSEALDAMQALLQAPDGTLAWKEVYYLSAVQPGQRSVLSEYGAPLSPREGERIEQQGTLVLDQCALERLWEILRRKK